MSNVLAGCGIPAFETPSYAKNWRKMRRGWKVILSIFAIAAYLNIGWALGTYTYDNVVYTTPKTVTAKIMAGG